VTLQELQVEIIENRKRRGWESAHNIDKTVLGLVEEYGELTLARETGDYAENVDAYVDIAVFALGGLQICGTSIVMCVPVNDGVLNDRGFTIGMFTFVKGIKQNDRTKQVRGLLDILSFCWLALRALEVEPLEAIAVVVERNKTRTHDGHH
jgi:hypothetical protein